MNCSTVTEQLPSSYRAVARAVTGRLLGGTELLGQLRQQFENGSGQFLNRLGGTATRRLGRVRETAVGSYIRFGRGSSYVGRENRPSVSFKWDFADQRKGTVFRRRRQRELTRGAVLIGKERSSWSEGRS